MYHLSSYFTYAGVFRSRPVRRTMFIAAVAAAAARSNHVFSLAARQQTVTHTRGACGWPGDQPKPRK
jgi:hypothetical protein